MVLEMYLPLLASKKEESRFEQIYYENRNLLYYCAYSILGDVQLSEDAVSEAFLALIKNMDKIAGNDAERTRSYLVIIVRNAARKICRSRKHEVITAPQELPDLTSIQMDIHAREAILNGAKFDEITYQSIKSDSGASINMCENCVHTFVEYLQSLAG